MWFKLSTFNDNTVPMSIAMNIQAASALVTAKYPINDPQSIPAIIARYIFFLQSYASSESFMKNPESGYSIGSKFMVGLLLIFNFHLKKINFIVFDLILYYNT